MSEDTAPYGKSRTSTSRVARITDSMRQLEKQIDKLEGMAAEIVAGIDTSGAKTLKLKHEGQLDPPSLLSLSDLLACLPETMELYNSRIAGVHRVLAGLLYD